MAFLSVHIIVLISYTEEEDPTLRPEKLKKPIKTY
jgi:hypothetical protein